MKKKLIIIGIVVAVMVALYFVYKNVKANKEAEDTTGGNAATQQAQTPTYNNNANPANSLTSGDSFPIKLGSSGNFVKLLQQKLNNKYKSGLTLDGQFGARTAEALKTATGKSEILNQDQFNYFMITGKIV